MKRVFTSTCLAMLCAAGLAAQTQTDDQKRKTEPARADEMSVTIVGCLRAGDTPNTFMLTNVKADESAAMPSAAAAPTPPNPPTPPTEPPSTPPMPPNPPSTPPTPQDPAAAAVGTSGAMSADVKLIGAPADLDLSKHVGHTVAITGSWVPTAKTARPMGTSGTAVAPEAKSFNVKSMEHKSESCK